MALSFYPEHHSELSSGILCFQSKYTTLVNTLSYVLAVDKFMISHMSIFNE